MRAVAARWWATAHRARSEEQERVGMPGPDARSSNRQVKQEKRRVLLADSRKYAVSSLGARPRPQPRTGPATCRANWLVGGERRRRRIVVSSACNFAPRARGASRCMRGAENLVLQEGQAARRDLTRALKAGPPGEGAERSHRLFFRFRLDFVLPAPPSVPGAPDTRCLLRRVPVQV